MGIHLLSNKALSIPLSELGANRFNEYKQSLRGEEGINQDSKPQGF